jgi:hypothetical protein
MPVSGKILEDSIRLAKIRRSKLALYIVQTITLVAIGFVAVFLMGGAALKPRLYLPIASFIAVIVLLLLIVCVESFFFRMLEIRFARSSSARHLMAKNSIKKAVIIAIITGVVTLVLTVPAALGAVESSLNDSTLVTADSNPVNFWSSDPLNLMTVEQVKVSAVAPVEVYLVTAKNYADYAPDKTQLASVRINRIPEQYIIMDEVTIEVPKGAYVEYYLVINDMESPGASVTISIIHTTSHTFTGTISLFMIAFVVSNVAWCAYLIPVERKYSTGSIYK